MRGGGTGRAEPPPPSLYPDAEYTQEQGDMDDAQYDQYVEYAEYDQCVFDDARSDLDGAGELQPPEMLAGMRRPASAIASVHIEGTGHMGEIRRTGQIGHTGQVRPVGQVGQFRPVGHTGQIGPIGQVRQTGQRLPSGGAPRNKPPLAPHKQHPDVDPSSTSSSPLHSQVMFLPPNGRAPNWAATNAGNVAANARIVKVVRRSASQARPAGPMRPTGPAHMTPPARHPLHQLPARVGVPRAPTNASAQATTGAARGPGLRAVGVASGANAVQRELGARKSAVKAIMPVQDAVNAGAVMPVHGAASGGAGVRVGRSPMRNAPPHSTSEYMKRREGSIIPGAPPGATMPPTGRRRSMSLDKAHAAPPGQPKIGPAQHTMVHSVHGQPQIGPGQQVVQPVQTQQQVHSSQGVQAAHPINGQPKQLQVQGPTQPGRFLHPQVTQGHQIARPPITLQVDEGDAFALYEDQGDPLASQGGPVGMQPVNMALNPKQMGHVPMIANQTGHVPVIANQTGQKAGQVGGNVKVGVAGGGGQEQLEQIRQTFANAGVVQRMGPPTRPMHDRNATRSVAPLIHATGGQYAGASGAPVASGVPVGASVGVGAPTGVAMPPKAGVAQRPASATALQAPPL